MTNANPQSTASVYGQTSPSFLHGLDVLSLEAPTKRQRLSFARVSERIRKGDSLETAIQSESRNIPAFFLRLLATPVPSNKLGALVERFIQICERHRDIKRQIISALLYPGLLVLVTCGIVYFMLSWSVVSFKSIFEDFGTELPAITIILIKISDIVVHPVLGPLFILGCAIGSAVGLWYLLYFLGGASGRRHVINSLPVIGGVFRFGSLAQFCDVLALLVEYNVPLPEALRLAGEGANDSSLQNASEQMATGAEQGIPLIETVISLSAIPPLAQQVFRWEGRQSSFVDGLRVVTDIFATRTQLQVGLLCVSLEPVVLTFISVTVGFIVLALFMPLIKLLNDLS